MRNALLLISVALLGGCGIDRGGAPAFGNDPNLDPSNVPTSTDTLIAGPISTISADALVIASTTISARATQIDVDDATSALDMLQPGQYAVVRGSTRSTSGTAASSIDVSTEVIGAASAFDIANNELTILGQQVIISAITTLDSALASTTLGDGIWLEPLRVSGFADALGNIFATYIAPEPAAPLRLTGFAQQVNPVVFTLRIGQQELSYTDATLIDLPDGVPSENARVTVTGTMDGAVFLIDTISEAQLLPDNLSDGAIVRLSAVVTQALANNSFAVGFFAATTDAATTVTDGTTADIVPGAIVTVTGSWTGSQTLEVDTVRIVRPPRL